MQILQTMYCPVTAEILYTEAKAEPYSEIAMPLHLWVDPNIESKGIIVLVHGLSQNAKSLDGLAREIAEKGFLVIGIDQRGHGNWHVASRKKEAGYKCDFRETVKDLKKLLAQIDDVDRKIPVFLMGESIGATVALRAAVESPNRVDGLILCSCGAKTNRLKTSWILSDLAFGLLRPAKEIAIERYQFKYACENSAVLAKTLDDKSARSGFRPGEIISIRRFFNSNLKYAKRLDPGVKLLMLAGTEDKLITSKQYEKLLSSAKCTDKTLAYIPSRGHMLIGRPDLSEYTKTTINAWLDKELNNKVATRSSHYD